VTPSTIAIDGPSASGKSTIGARLAESLGYLYFDTGVMYRAVAAEALRRDIPLGDEPAVSSMAEEMQIEVMSPTVDDGRDATVLVEGRDVTLELRLPEVEKAVSTVSAYPAVRAAMRAQQRRIAESGRIVMVGRDIGTAVLPEADLKIYLDATLQERAQRRHAERRARGETISFDQVLQDMRRRDRIDSSRTHSPLQVAPDAILVDTSGMSIEQVLERAGALARAGGRADGR
jgi:cytidylate kinase